MKKNLYFCCLLLPVLLLGWQVGWGQTVLLDDFTRANSTTVGNGWTEVETVTSGLQISSNRLLAGSTTAGREWAYQSVSSNYTTAGISTNTSVLTWAFNFRNTRTDPSGFDNGNYGLGFILGSSSTFATVGTGNGYAVVIGQGGATDPIRLARFTSGVNLNARFTNIISGNDYGTEYLSVKVTFTPSTSTWVLYAESSTTAFPQADPRNTATQIGSATIDNTYTSTANNLQFVGPFWNHNTAATDNAIFDDIYIPNVNSATCSITGASASTATCTGTDASFDVSFSEANTSGNFDVINTATSAVLASGTASPITVTIANSAGSSLDIQVVDQSDATCASSVVTVTVPNCVSCNISAIALSNAGSCNDNGTPTDATDDYYTADVTVTFGNAFATGTLDLTGSGTASVAVGSLGSATSHTFIGVQLPANGATGSLTATFSADATCTFTNASISGVAPCSVVPCADLFISEYGEGSSGTSKYIEIYNPTGSAITLTGNYRIWSINGGGNWPESFVDFPAGATVAAYDVYVVANNVSDIPGADFYNASTSISFNGDDAIGIAKNDGLGVYALIDAIGENGADPGSGWAVAGTANATVDNTLVRKATVNKGNIDWTASRGTNTTNSEWTVTAYTTGAPATLGSHLSNCQPVSNCSITGISLTETAPCDNNGTPAISTDDFLTAEITITFSNAPATGNLVLSGSVSATVAVGSLGAGTYTFTGVQVPSNGTTVTVNVGFSADLTCTGSQAFGPYAPCTTPTVGFVSASGKIAERFSPGYAAVTMDIVPGADVQVTVSDLGTGTATGGGVDYTFTSTVLTFPAIGVTYPYTQTVSIAVVNDAVADNNETIDLGLAVTTGTALTSITARTVTLEEAAPGLILNEFSQGSSGTKEFVEFIVDGVPGTTVDLRGWIFDDNNGVFSNGVGSGLGIAAGYIAFQDNCTWEKVPVGSLIVFYNQSARNLNIPAADPTDANFDYTYIIPIDGGPNGVSCTTPANNDYFDGNSTVPNNVDPSYPGVTDEPCFTTIGFRNDGDAVQLRKPDGSFFQGISYGTKGGTSDCPTCELSAENHPFYSSFGDRSVYFTESGGNTVYFFSNAVNNDFNNKDNWATGADSAATVYLSTPGAINSTANAAYINALRQPFTVATTTSNYACDLRPLETRTYLNASDEIILQVVNQSSFDHGSTNAQVNFGGGIVQNNNLADAPIFADPEWVLTPTNTDPTQSYSVKFFVSDAVLTAYAAQVNVLQGTSYTAASITSLIQVYKGLGTVDPKTTANQADLTVVAPTVGSFTTGGVTYTTFEAAFTTFSTFALGAPQATLPVELLSFRGYPSQGDVALEWVTSREENTGFFAVERSLDQVNFEEIGTVTAAGNSNSPSNYAFLDTKAATGFSYYRLRVVDMDGSFHYATAVKVQLLAGADLALGQVFPNPANQEVFVEVSLAVSGPVQARLMSVDGRVIVDQTESFQAGLQAIRIDLADVAAGVYVLEVQQNGQRVYGKVVKR